MDLMSITVYKYTVFFCYIPPVGLNVSNTVQEGSSKRRTTFGYFDSYK